MRPNIDAITSRKVRLFLSEHPFKHYGHVPNFIEMLRLNSATQVDVFYGLCETLQRPPTQEEFVVEYLKACQSEIIAKGAEVGGVSMRVARAWASYIGELDFYCMLRDASTFDEVILDTEFDVKYGYDVVVIDRGATFPIHLSFAYDEETAKFWLEQKAKRKADVSIKPIEFPRTRDNSDVIGGVYLYKLERVRELEEKLRELTPVQTPF